MSAETSSSNQMTEESKCLVPEELYDAKLHRPRHVARKLEEDWYSSETCFELVFTIPYRLLSGVLRPIAKLMFVEYNYVREGDLVFQCSLRNQ